MQLILFLLLATPAAYAQQYDFLETPATPATPEPAAKPEIFRENLINNSPFRAVRWGRSTAQQQPLELHGFSGAGANLTVSLTNPATRECAWVRVRDENAKWFVESADSEKRTAVVKLDGVALNLEIIQANETPLPTTPVAVPATAPAPTAAAAAAPANATSATTPVVGTRVLGPGTPQQPTGGQQQQPAGQGRGAGGTRRNRG